MLKSVVNSPVRSGNQTIIDGNLVIGTAGKGIDFSASSSAAGMTSELLDDYEHGTFTPTIIGLTTPGVGTYTVQVGTYTKIGNRVMFQASLAWTAHTGTGSMRVSGLPFTSNATSNNTGTASLYANFVAMNAGNVLQGYIPISNNQVALDQVPTGGGLSTAVPIDTNVAYFIVAGQYEV